MISKIDTEFPQHMTYQEAQNLKVGDVIDHRDNGGWFVNATIVEKQDSMCKIHYDGWGNRYDCWSSYDKELCRFAKRDIFSRRPAHQLADLKVGDCLEIKLENIYLQSVHGYYSFSGEPKCVSTDGWTIGKILEFDRRNNSGQVKVRILKNHLTWVWVHLDNTNECQRIGIHTNTPICLHCKKGIITDEIFVSPNCNDSEEHCYHSKCASEIINESLSLFNEIPKCVMYNCNKSFNHSLSKTLNHTLLSRYRMCQLKSKQYQNDAALLSGYINTNKTENMLFPNDIIQLIHDFYKLVLYTSTSCDNCHSGFEPCIRCTDGTITSKCTYKYCANGKVAIVQDCTVCVGGKGRWKKVKCNCWMNFFPVCKSCDGYGFRAGYGGRGECSECNGSGEICPDHCFDGYYLDFIDCDACDASGLFHTINTCSRCDGVGCIVETCVQCNGKTYTTITCHKCKGSAAVYYTDFNKVISKQQRCHKCNLYYTNDMITYWSGCHHIFCDSCIVDSYHIEDAIESDTVPVCPIQDCKEELKEKDLILLYKHKGIDEYQLATLMSQFNMIIFRKNNFECDLCSLWHNNQEKIVLCCGCKCGIECRVKMSIQNSVYHNAIPICDNCFKELELDDIELICGKNYALLVETLIHNKRFEALVTMQHTHINANDTMKVLKLRHPDLNCNDDRLKDRIIDFLNLIHIKIEDIEYLNIIPTKSTVPLFQLFLKNETIARTIYLQISNLIQKQIYQKWSVGYWQIYKQQTNNQNYRGYNGRQYNYQRNNFRQDNNNYFNNTSYGTNNDRYQNHRSTHYQNNNY